jgi:uncharacterized protein
MTDVLFRQISPISTPKARYPGFRPGTSEVIARGSVRSRGHRPVPCDILWERDVAVAMRDGTRLYTDIFRPADATGLLPTLLVWNPYGKLSGSWSLADLPFNSGVPKSATTGWESFEAPDPGYWCDQGYAVITPDIRGVFKSEGNFRCWGTAAALDGCDFIEWIGQQPWSNGKVGMTGNSQLAIMQWFIAAERPPCLAAIAPWEALIDMHRNDVMNGGISDALFYEYIMNGIYGENMIEDVSAMCKRHPLFSDYWQDKVARVEDIAVPAYVVASWTNPVHARGTFWAWQRLRTKNRWLRVHNTQEWPDYYDPQNMADLCRFFDYYLKGADNGWTTTPRVRLSVLDPGGKDEVNRPVAELPIPGTRYNKLYLDAANASMDFAQPAAVAVARYDATSSIDKAVFTHRFTQETELIGAVSLRLWVEVEGHDDADLHIVLEKLDRRGKPLVHIFLPLPTVVDRLLRLAIKSKWIRAKLPPVLFYGGPFGRIKVALRRLDEALSSEGQPVQRMTAFEPLHPGEIVPVDIALTPTGMRFHPGEQLRVHVAGFDMRGSFFTDMPAKPNHNQGTHILHTGGRFDSYLVLPIPPAPD